MATKTRPGEKNRIGVIYARFSSHNQREESIEQQVAECKLYAAANNIQIIDIYADSAKTGRSDRRPQFQRLHRDAKKGKFAVILAYKSNRIARNMLNAMMFENDMERMGIQLLYAKEEFGNNAAGRFALRTMMNVNQFYSENMAEDIKRSQMDNAQNCKTNGPTSFGYRAGEDGRFVVNEPEAAVVREIFARVACGESYVSIAKSLNGRGIHTRLGNPWGKSSFTNILRNERYIGTYRFGDVRIKGGMPAIISEQVFYEVQHIMEHKKTQSRRRGNAEYLLTGKLYCGECGDHMVGMSGTGKNGTSHYYYMCSHKRPNGNCTKTNVRRDYIEYELARGIRQYVLQNNIIEKIADLVETYQKERRDAPELKALEERLKATKQATANMLRAIEQGIVNATVRDRLIELETEQSEVAEQIAQFQAECIPVTREQVITWLHSFESGDIHDKEYRATLFNAFLHKVYIFDDGHVKAYLNWSSVPSDSISIDLAEPDASDIALQGSQEVLQGPPDGAAVESAVLFVHSQRQKAAEH